MEEVFIAEALRTPGGKLMGGLSTLRAPELFSILIKESIKRLNIRRASVDEVITGNALSAGLGQNPARQAAILGGLPFGVSALTVNMVCASGMRAIAIGAQAIRTGEADLVIAGGAESMSNAPFISRDMRKGKRYGDGALIDCLIHDGLWDFYYNAHMGTLCELTVKRYGITREEQDRFSIQSHGKAMMATKNGLLKDEIVPVRIENNGIKKTIAIDETIRWDTSLRKLSLLKPAFKKNGTITAGNSPGLNDGAASLVIMSGKKLKQMNLKPLAEIIGFSIAHLDPKWYPIAPVKSIKTLLKKTRLKIEDFDLMEENEAFAAQTLAVIKELSVDPKKVNVHGGGIALGHPIGASGARILVTLIHALRNRGKNLGLATICLGGGGAMSAAIRVFND